jgi:hypothetical protein
MVTASRRHLTERYAAGVDRLLWDTEKRLVPDLDAIRSVVDAASAGHAEALDIGAGLVLLQAARLEVDRLEYDVFEGAHAMGMGEEAIAAVLDLPDAATAAKRRRWLKVRRALPYADIGAPGPGGSAEAANRAGRRASQAANRAAEAAQRREQLSQRDHAADSSRQHAERAAANAGEARVLAGEAIERVALGLLRAAAGLDRCAAGCEELASAGTVRRPELRGKADEYHQAAVKYREMAAEYRADGQDAEGARATQQGGTAEKRVGGGTHTVLPRPA